MKSKQHFLIQEFSPWTSQIYNFNITIEIFNVENIIQHHFTITKSIQTT